MPGTYFNEIDAGAAAWLRELIKAEVVSAGEVDERSIEDVAPNDLAGRTRCHFFSGIGVWDYALKLAGFPADREVWTGSCPCQPFSSAGKGDGFDDERHLWPTFFHLISQRRPQLLFGEQVASNDAMPWIDLVHADLEAIGYTVGALVAPAAGFGAPHGRHRIYWVAKLARAGHEAGHAEQRVELRECDAGTGQSGATHELALAGGRGCEPGEQLGAVHERDEPGRAGVGDGGNVSAGVPLGDASVQRCEGCAVQLRESREGQDERGLHNQSSPSRAGATRVGVVMDDADGTGFKEQCGAVADGSQHTAAECAGATNGFWGNADWLPCTDGKQRPVEPGTLPLVDGLAGDLGLVRLASHPDRPHEERLIHAPLIQKGKARKMRLRGYGNAIVLWQAVAFIRAFLEAEEEGKA